MEGYSNLPQERCCGCIIINDGRVLLIGALDDDGELFWAFPKGHQDSGESDIETALRETKEEVGLDVKITDDDPIVTGHLVKSCSTYKTILLYLAEPIGGDVTPQVGEVEKAEWVPIPEAAKYLKRYYSEVWQKVLARLASVAD
ncbi:MAG: NUDIX hydrolase [Candidatus Saccharibacteria bacterium]|nr:NUDIX hydrolase [Candidatus Saccharibacteria bacterium]